MVTPVPGVTMVEYKWRKRKVSARLSPWNVRNARNGIIPTEKNRRNDPSRMELKKYCPRCKEHTMHREVK